MEFSNLWEECKIALNSCFTVVLLLEKGAYPENSHIFYCHINFAFC